MTAVVDRPTTAALDDLAPAQFVLPTPLASVSADLLPDEIRVRRRLAKLKRGLIVVLATLLILIALGLSFARHQTGSAQDALTSANGTIGELNSQLGTFNAVLSTQSETEAIRAQLAGVMGNNVSWTGLVNELSTAAPNGLTVATISAQVMDPNDASATSTDTSGLVTSTQPTIGSLTLAGVAPNWQAVATYVRNLSAIKGFTAVNPSTLSTTAGSVGTHAAATHGLTFTVELNLTTAVLGHSNSATGAASTNSTTTTGNTTTGSTATTNTGAGNSATGNTATTNTATTNTGADSHLGSAGSGPTSQNAQEGS